MSDQKMISNLQGIEKNFCSAWSAWDELDTGVMMFYDPVLLPEIKDKIGVSFVSYIVVDTQKSKVQFYINSEDDGYLDFDLKVSI